MKKQATTQKEAVKMHLENYGHLNDAEARINYGISRLASIIHKLKGENWNIKTIKQHHVSRFGNKGTYAIYRLVL